jgi:hypothetical protein
VQCRAAGRAGHAVALVSGAFVAADDASSPGHKAVALAVLPIMRVIARSGTAYPARQAEIGEGRSADRTDETRSFAQIDRWREADRWSKPRRSARCSAMGAG